MRALFCFYVIITLLNSPKGFSQKTRDNVRDEFAAELKKIMINDDWKMFLSPQNITLHYMDTFFINESISPINNRNGFYNKLDTLNIKIRFENNWTQLKYDSIKLKQQIILKPLIEKYIAYCDSIQWKYMKSNKAMFLERPYTNLNGWSKLTDSENNLLKHFIRLPDKLVDSIGVFVDSDYSPYMEIEPEKVSIKVYAFYDKLCSVLGRSALYKAEDKY